MDSGIEFSRKINDHDVDLTIFTKTNLPKPNEIGAATPDYVDQQIALITETGIPKLSKTPLPLLVAEEEGQTEFSIEMETFDKVTDSVDVYKGHLHLHEGADFTVNEKTITLVEGVPVGTTIAITVMKNVPLGEDGSVSGTVISPKTLPVKALEDGALEKLGGASKTYVEQLVATITETGIPKLNVNAFELVAEADGQRLFNINMDTFDAVTDTVLVLDGRGLLLPNSDYTVSGRTITVSEGWNAGDVGGYIVLKNVPMGSDGSVSGAVITPKTLPLDRLAEMPSANDIGARPNANLLHNWYFGNPVNRNGLSEYTAKNVTIDRWTLTGVVARIELLESAVKLEKTGDGGYSLFHQTLEDIPAGTVLTASIVADGELYSVTSMSGWTYPTTGNATSLGVIYPQSKSGGGYSLAILADVTGEILFRLYFGGSTPANEAKVTITACKLELGDTQTLAHKENGVWVLNEIPDYAEQMAICSQYDVSSGAYLGTGLRPAYSRLSLSSVLENPSESTDIRALMHKVDSGLYLQTTTSAKVSNIVFPTSGDVLIDWEKYHSQQNSLIYGRLVIRSLINKGLKFECSIYNNTSYTEWEQPIIADGSVPISAQDVFLNNGFGRLFSVSGICSGLQQLDEPFNRDLNRSINVFNHINQPDVARALQFYDTLQANTQIYNIFGEHNKPSGSYTGNGSATKRVIETGGIGNVIMITGNNHSFLVMPWGAIGINNSNQIITLGGHICNFNIGKLEMSTSNNAINQNGYNFLYQVL